MKPFRGVVTSVIILSCFSIFLCFGQEAGQETGQNPECLGCHENTVNSVNQENRYIHSPFSQFKCSFCHLKSEGVLEDERHGYGLRCRDEMGISVCYTCHPQERLGVSHPVGIYPTPKIRIPKELPTGSRGQLLCISCHSPHGSNEEYLGRKPVSDKLCVACHGEDYLK